MAIENSSFLNWQVATVCNGCCFDLGCPCSSNYEQLTVIRGYFSLSLSLEKVGKNAGMKYSKASLQYSLHLHTVNYTDMNENLLRLGFYCVANIAMRPQALQFQFPPSML